jgi:hypothetical protein
LALDLKGYSRYQYLLNFILGIGFERVLKVPYQNLHNFIPGLVPKALELKLGFDFGNNLIVANPGVLIQTIDFDI